MAQDMNFLDSFFATIKDSNKKQIQNTKKELNITQKRQRLKNIQLQISKYYKTYYNRKKNRTKWASILGNVSYEIRYNEIRASQELEQQFMSYLAEAYELTTQILADLNLIHTVRTVITSIGDNYSYFRFPNMELEASFLFLNAQSSKRGANYGLRIKESQINLLKQLRGMTEIDIALENHFQAFIDPFVSYQIHAVNTTHWKINKGVLGETFQRHLQRKVHNNINDLRNNSIEHLGSIGQRWVLYKESSGSDPFFTGPDTELSQVKNANASIVSNIQTLITTIDGVLELVDQEGKITRPAQDLEKIFQQADLKFSIQKDIYEDLQSQAPQIIKDILKSVLKQGETEITLKGRNKKGNKKYKIDKQNLSLIIQEKN